LINLLVNASQAIEEKGEITIKTYVQDEYLVVDITDNGKGIPEDNLKKIFDPFFTTKPVGQGTGLGLSVSYEIIKKHGGDIQVKSIVGKGSTFSVRLPTG
jgi:two-component system NtrC family sensor kinase